MAEVIGMTDDTIEWAPLAATVRNALAQKVRQQVQPPGTGLHGWQPRYDESVVAVAGMAGSVGATTVSLALASVAALTGPARIIECAPPTRSGLTAAAAAELGTGRGGWARGQREGVTLIRRSSSSLFDAAPPPPEEEGTFTVLDVGDLLTDRPGEHPVAADVAGGWVLVARASVPCLRQLELVLDLGLVHNPTLAIVGTSPRRWPTALASAVQPRTRTLLESGRVVTFRHDKRLALIGLTPDPLPRHVAASARTLLSFLEGLPQ
jgi:Mrp family chromosome partitioning ATPase